MQYPSKAQSVLFAAAFFVICLLFSSFIRDAILEWRLEVRSRQFATAQGTISKSSMERVSRGERFAWAPVIEFEYSVADTEYASTDIQPYDTYFNSQSQCESFMSSHQMGAIVNVYYDPANPSTALLINSPHKDSQSTSLKIAAVFIPALLALGGWTAIYWLVKTHRRSTGAERH